VLAVRREGLDGQAQTSNPVVLLDDQRLIVNVKDAGLALFGGERDQLVGGRSLAIYVAVSDDPSYTPSKALAGSRRSTLVTLAPRSASTVVASRPASTREKSTVRRSASASAIGLQA
jgi:hypothetical protein